MKPTKHLLTLVALVGLAVHGHASNITWGSAQNITADTDVSLTGTLVRAVNLTPLNGNTTSSASTFPTNLNINITMNSVTFIASPRTNAIITDPMILQNGDIITPSDGSRVGPSSGANQFQGFGGPAATVSTLTNFSLLSPVYQKLLATAYWNDGDYLNPTTTAMYTLTLTNLTVGRTYALQVWVNDSRLSNLGQNNPDLYTRFSADNFTTYVDLQHNMGNTNGGTGQYAIGSFTADATSQVLTFAGGNAPGVDIDATSCTAVLNAYQLRDISSTNYVTGGGGVCPGDPGVSVGVSGTVVGIDYQLQRNGANLNSPVGGTGAPLSFGIFYTPGVYTVVQSNTTTTVTGFISGSATVSSNQVPAIVTSPTPVSSTNALGGITVYTVSATGTGLIYQWRHAGTNISNGNGYSGVNTATLTINPLNASHAGNYDCVVSGTCSPSATSDAASLSLFPPRNLTWVGGGANLWDTTTANWTGDATIYKSYDNVTINNSGNNSPAIDMVGLITPLAVTVSNTIKDFTIGTTTTGSLGGYTTLTKAGSAKLTLTTSNSFTGKTAVNGGILSISSDNRLGAVPGSATADQLTLNGGTLEVTDNGSIPVNRGTTLGASGGVYSIPTGVSVTNDSVITGAGSLTKADAGEFTVSTLNTYAGNITVNGGILRGIITQNSGGNSVFGVITNTRTITVNNGAIISFDRGNIFASGTSTDVTPAPHIIVNQGGTLRTVINDGNNFGKITLNGATFALGQGHGPVYGAAILTDTITVGGSSASTISGNGASSSTANLGYNTSTNGIIFDVADATGNSNADLIITADLRNAANTAVGESTNSLVKMGPGTLSLEASPVNNEYTGLTVISNGTLRGTATILGSVVVYGSGKIGGGADAGVGTLTVGGSLTFAGGGAYMRVDRSGPSSDLVSVSGTLTNSGGGTVSVENIGLPLQVGDSFTLFSQPVINGGAMSVTGGGVTWSNSLAIDGKITVASLATIPSTPTNITYSASGSTLSLSWPASYLGWILQSQTNSLSVGLVTNASSWYDWPGSASVTSTNLNINPANPTVFFRLRHP